MFTFLAFKLRPVSPIKVHNERNVNVNKNTSENAALNKMFYPDERAPSCGGEPLAMNERATSCGGQPNVSVVASHWQHCVQLTSSRFEPQSSHSGYKRNTPQPTDRKGSIPRRIN